MSDTLPVRRPQVARVTARRARLPLALGLLVLGSAVFAKMIDNRDRRIGQSLSISTNTWPNRLACVSGTIGF